MGPSDRGEITEGEKLDSVWSGFTWFSASLFLLVWSYIQRSFWEIFQLQENLGYKADTVAKQRQNFPSSRSAAGKHMCAQAAPFAQIDLCTHVLTPTIHTSGTAHAHAHAHSRVASVAPFRIAHSPVVGCGPGIRTPDLGGFLCQYFEIQASPPRTLNRWWVLLTKMIQIFNQIFLHMFIFAQRMNELWMDLFSLY